VIANLKPYAQYKDSGLPWLGQVPAHWRVMRNGSLFGQRSQTGYAELPILEVSLKTGVQVRSFGGAKRKQVMSDFGKYKRAVRAVPWRHNHPAFVPLRPVFHQREAQSADKISDGLVVVVNDQGHEGDGLTQDSRTSARPMAAGIA